MNISFPKFLVFCSLMFAFRLKSPIFSSMILDPRIFKNRRSSDFLNPREEEAILASSFSSFLHIKGPYIATRKLSIELSSGCCTRLPLGHLLQKSGTKLIESSFFQPSSIYPHPNANYEPITTSTSY